MTLALRPYQDQAIRDILAAVEGGTRSICAVAPTGAGKTVVGSNLVDLICNNGHKALVLAHRKELIDQMSRTLDRIGLTDHGVIQGRHPRTDYGRPVQVGSVQTLLNRMGEAPMDYQLVMIDECHHATADSYVRIIDAVRERMSGVVTLGLTATPYRSDGKGLGRMYDQIVEVSTTQELIEQGYLVPPRVYCGPRLDLGGVRTVAGDYDKAALGRMMTKPKLAGDILRHWHQHAAGRQTVVFAVNVAHSMMLRDEFDSAGIPAVHVDYEMPKGAREDALEAFASGEFRVLCNCMLLSEGWDCPQVSAIVLARPTKSRGLWRQMCGRALRPYPGKIDCVILDHAGLYHEHGLLTDPDDVTLDDGVKRAQEREATDPAESEVMCLNLLCGAVFKRLAALLNERREPLCPHCGEPVPAQTPEVDASVTLEEVASEVFAKRESAREERREFYKETAEKYFDAGFHAGTAWASFVQKFGEEPTPYDTDPSRYYEEWIKDPVTGERVMVWKDWTHRVVNKKRPKLRSRIAFGGRR